MVGVHADNPEVAATFAAMEMLGKLRPGDIFQGREQPEAALAAQFTTLYKAVRKVQWENRDSALAQE